MGKNHPALTRISKVKKNFTNRKKSPNKRIFDIPVILPKMCFIVI